MQAVMLGPTTLQLMWLSNTLVMLLDHSIIGMTQLLLRMQMSFTQRTDILLKEQMSTLKAMIILQILLCLQLHQLPPPLQMLFPYQVYTHLISKDLSLDLTKLLIPPLTFMVLAHLSQKQMEAMSLMKDLSQILNISTWLNHLLLHIHNSLIPYKTMKFHSNSMILKRLLN